MQQLMAPRSFRCAARALSRVGGDGQVTLGNVVIKSSARKVRRLYHGKVLAEFSLAAPPMRSRCSSASGQAEKHQGHLLRSAVELAKDWRTDRMLRRLKRC